MSYLVNPYIFGEPLPVTNVYARYTADSFSGTTWADISGNGRNATVTRGTVTKVSSTGNGAYKTFDTLQGGTGDGIQFPTDVLPSTYTLFHVTRYQGTANARIITGITNNWLSGHYGGSSGVAYHEGWITRSSPSFFGNDWLITTDQNSLYRGNGYTYGSSGGSVNARLSVNAGSTAEYSAWQCSEVIVYNRTLSALEYESVERFLSKKYEIANLYDDTMTLGLAGKFFNGDWRSTISTGNIGTLPLTTTNNSSNVGGTGGMPSAAHRYGVNVWPYITYTTLGDTYGFIAIGYFNPTVSGSYSFWTSSDDGSGIWLGDIASASSGRTTANALVNNGLGVGQGNTKRGASTTLVGGQTYAIRVVQEEGGGGDNLTLSWTGPGMQENTNLMGYFRTPVVSGVLTGNY